MMIYGMMTSIKMIETIRTKNRERRMDRIQLERQLPQFPWEDDSFQRRACVEAAIEKFNVDEVYLIEKRLSERCICARFAIYLENEVRKRFSVDYVADVEYNRGADGDEYLQKVLHGERIYPDLIVHKRGYDPVIGYDNMICIEMKKQEDCRGLGSDQRRLRALTYMGPGGPGFVYRSGFMIVIHKKPKGLKIESEYVNGILVDKSKRT